MPIARLLPGLLTILIVGSFAIAGCDRDGPAEEAGESVDEAAERLKENVDEAGNKVEDACEDVKEGVDAEDTDC